MELIIGFIVAFLGCIVYLSLSKRKDKKISSKPTRSNVLYGSSNRNSYTNAREVFKTLKDAGIEINFLGGKHE